MRSILAVAMAALAGLARSLAYQTRAARGTITRSANSTSRVE